MIVFQILLNIFISGHFIVLIHMKSCRLVIIDLLYRLTTDVFFHLIDYFLIFTAHEIVSHIMPPSTRIRDYFGLLLVVVTDGRNSVVIRKSVIGRRREPALAGQSFFRALVHSYASVNIDLGWVSFEVQLFYLIGLLESRIALLQVVGDLLRSESLIRLGSGL